MAKTQSCLNKVHCLNKIFACKQLQKSFTLTDWFFFTFIAATTARKSYFISNKATGKFAGTYN